MKLSLELNNLAERAVEKEGMEGVRGKRRRVRRFISTD